MDWILGTLYLWLKAAHVIFVIFWMAGLFMLPRFFVYHQQCAAGSAEDASWIEREDRLRRIILTPALVLVWLLGIALILASYANGRPILLEGWLHLKLLLVLLLSGYHGWLAGYAKKLAHGQRPISDKRLRLVNEVPGIFVAAIVILAIVKPF